MVGSSSLRRLVYSSKGEPTPVYSPWLVLALALGGPEILEDAGLPNALFVVGQFEPIHRDFRCNRARFGQGKFRSTTNGVYSSTHQPLRGVTTNF